VGVQQSISNRFRLDHAMKSNPSCTIDENKNLVKSKRRNFQKYGCVRQPLFHTIPIDHIIPDVLHLFLRICDVLINLLITELRRLDGIEKARLEKFDHTKVVNVVKYEKFLNEACKISFHFFVDKDAKVARLDRTRKVKSV